MAPIYFQSLLICYGYAIGLACFLLNTVLNCSSIFLSFQTRGKCLFLFPSFANWRWRQLCLEGGFNWSWHHLLHCQLQGHAGHIPRARFAGIFIMFGQSWVFSLPKRKRSVDTQLDWGRFGGLCVGNGSAIANGIYRNNSILLVEGHKWVVNQIQISTNYSTNSRIGSCVTSRLDNGLRRWTASIVRKWGPEQLLSVHLLKLQWKAANHCERNGLWSWSFCLFVCINLFIVVQELLLKHSIFFVCVQLWCQRTLPFGIYIWDHNHIVSILLSDTQLSFSFTIATSLHFIRNLNNAFATGIFADLVRIAETRNLVPVRDISELLGVELRSENHICMHFILVSRIIQDKVWIIDSFNVVVSRHYRIIASLNVLD